MLCREDLEQRLVFWRCTQSWSVLSRAWSLGKIIWRIGCYPSRKSPPLHIAVIVQITLFQCNLQIYIFLAQRFIYLFLPFVFWEFLCLLKLAHTLRTYTLSWHCFISSTSRSVLIFDINIMVYEWVICSFFYWQYQLIPIIFSIQKNWSFVSWWIPLSDKAYRVC